MEEVARQLRDLWNFIELNPSNFDWKAIENASARYDMIQLGNFYRGTTQFPTYLNIPIPGLILNVLYLMGKVPSNYINWMEVAKDYIVIGQSKQGYSPFHQS